MAYVPFFRSKGLSKCLLCAKVISFVAFVINRNLIRQNIYVQTFL